MKYLPFLLTLVALTGCNMPNTKPGDGRQWMELSCSGFADWTKCQEKARSLCPGGYDISNQEENMVTQKRTMLVACQQESNRSGEVLPE
jgi:hypothetical protein